jgi:hypothetical protein
VSISPGSSTGSGHGDLQATTRYVKILDEEDSKAADFMSAIFGEAAWIWTVRCP